jgi:hypothetical protein
MPMPVPLASVPTGLTSWALPATGSDGASGGAAGIVNASTNAWTDPKGKRPAGEVLMGVVAKAAKVAHAGDAGATATAARTATTATAATAAVAATSAAAVAANAVSSAGPAAAFVSLRQTLANPTIASAAAVALGHNLAALSKASGASGASGAGGAGGAGGVAIGPSATALSASTSGHSASDIQLLIHIKNQSMNQASTSSLRELNSAMEKSLGPGGVLSGGGVGAGAEAAAGGGGAGGGAATAAGGIMGSGLTAGAAHLALATAGLTNMGRAAAVAGMPGMPASGNFAAMSAAGMSAAGISGIQSMMGMAPGGGGAGAGGGGAGAGGGAGGFHAHMNQHQHMHQHLLHMRTPQLQSGLALTQHQVLVLQAVGRG